MTPGNIPSLGHALKRQMPISLLPQLNLDRIRQYLLLGPMIKKKKKVWKMLERHILPYLYRIIHNLQLVTNQT